MIDTLLNTIIPHLCISCGEIGAIICVNCKYDIVSASKRNMPVLITNCDKSWYVGNRKAVLQRIVGSYKFNGVRAAALPLAHMLSETAPLIPLGSIVTLIPTLPRHIRERGYDHMKHIAKQFAALQSLEVEIVLERQKQFVQHRSDRSTRFAQVKGAFSIQSAIQPDRTYILLDDIYTTGATIQEAVHVLKANGAKAVYVGIIARQPLD